MTRIPYTTRHRQRPPSGMVGFTLIELMVTIAVAAILLAVAVPSFRHLIISNRLTTAANDVVTALTVARSEAIKRNADVGFNNDTTVTVPPAAAAVTTIRAAITLPSSVAFANPPQQLVATPAGLLQVAGAAAGYSGLVADVTSNAINSDNHRCIYLTTGSTVSSCTDSAACGGGAPNATCTSN